MRYENTVERIQNLHKLELSFSKKRSDLATLERNRQQDLHMNTKT